jgi:2-methylcitrate dehydratase
MICIDEIRGRLAEVFSLKSYKIDHVVHGAIASAAVYGALMGATATQIESAIGMTVAHYVPFRAIRAGHQLSDSKGASAAISAEVAVLSMKRAMKGFVGPADIFRNPEAIFRFFEPTTGAASSKDTVDIALSNKKRWGPGDSPFNLVLSHSGDDFAVVGMHFKLGLYEHQSAGALQGLVDLLVKNPEIAASGADGSGIEKIHVIAYEPAYGIIGDPAKKNPKTRQSADHSMAHIVGRMLTKALKAGKVPASNDGAWETLMLSPYDYGAAALTDADTRALMHKTSFAHGGKEYDDKYPEGIPTSIELTLKGGKVLSSGLVMFPSGHARDTKADLQRILDHKNKLLGDLVFQKPAKREAFVQALQGMKGATDLQELYNFDMQKDVVDQPPIDGPPAKL